MPIVSAGIGLFRVRFEAHLVGDAHVIPLLVGGLGSVFLVYLRGVLLHLLLGDSAGEQAIGPGRGNVKAIFQVVIELVTDVDEQILGILVAMLPVSVPG